MKKIITFLILTLFLFQLSIPLVSASTNIYGGTVVLLDDEGEDCEGIFGSLSDEESFAYYLNEIFGYIQFLGPTLVVVMTIIEFAKAAASNDKEALMKAGKKTGTRIALALLLFFLPLLINFVFKDVLHWYGTCGIG